MSAAQTPTVLERILQSTREELERRKLELPLGELEYQAFAIGGAGGASSRRFAAALREPGISVIAEFKRRSPSAGTLHEAPDLHELLSAYERGGASALSVLTEGPNFNGSLEDLAGARAACSLPILRKDFIVDEYQVYEAAVAGADAILLIVAAMEVGPLANLHALAGRLGLATLVEVHNAQELRVAVEIGAETIGINNRNLSTLVVDIETTYHLLPQIPAGVVKVAESGFRTRAELERLAAAGLDAVLIGEALIRSPDIEAAARELTGVDARRISA